LCCCGILCVHCYGDIIFVNAFNHVVDSLNRQSCYVVLSLLHSSNANLCTAFSVIKFSLPDYYFCGQQKKNGIWIINGSRWQPFFWIMRNLLSSFMFCAYGELCFFGVEDLQLAARNVLFGIHKSQSTVVSRLALHEVLRGTGVKVFVQTK